MNNHKKAENLADIKLNVEEITELVKWELEFGYALQTPEAERDLNLGLDFLVIATEDIKASLLLFKNEFYAQSVFYLQQCVEKLGKSLLIFMGIINDVDKIRNKVGHHFTKYLIKHMTKVLNSFPTSALNISFSDFEQYSRDFFRKNRLPQGKSLLYPYGDLKEVIKSYNDIYTSFQIVRDKIISKETEINLKQNLKSNEEIIFLTLESLVEKPIEDIPEIKNQLDTLEVKEFLLTFSNTISIILNLFFLTIIDLNTSHHCSLTRYPSNLAIEYNSETDIIKLYPLMYELIAVLIKETWLLVDENSGL